MCDDRSVNENIEWALERLRKFETDARPIYIPSPPSSIGFHSYKSTAPLDEILKQSAVVEQILDKYTPNWRNVTPDKNERYRFRVEHESALRCIAVLEAREEVERHLVDRGPSL